MATALYRKLRPLRFADVVGQDDVVGALKNEIKTGRVSHAYILTGIRGTGKTTLARIIAKAVNCPNMKDGEPCGECDVCRGIDDGSLLDVTEIDAASYTGVDSIRALRDETAFSPAVCKKRVYIIDEVHMLSASAFNALLKILEEPPEHVMFVMATTEIHKVPPTILSRCQRFDLRRLPAGEIADYLLGISGGEGIKLAADAAARIARLADGSMRDALSLLDTCAAQGEVSDETVRRLAGAADRSRITALAERLAEKDIAGALDAVAALYADSIDPSRLCWTLTRYFRCVLLSQLDSALLADECDAQEKAEYDALSARFSREEVIKLIKILNFALDSLPRTADPRLALELALINICTGDIPAAGQDLPQPAAPRPKKTAAAPQQTVPSAAHNAPEAPQPVPVRREDKEAAPQADSDAETPQQTQNPAVQPPEGDFAQWQQVLERVKTMNGMLYGLLSGSKAYCDGSHLLIDAPEAFYECMRVRPQSKEMVKKAIADITGCTLPIGPWRRAEVKPDAQDSVMEIFDRAKKLGIDTKITGEDLK